MLSAYRFAPEVDVPDPIRAAALQAAVAFHGSVGDLDLRLGVASDETIAAGELAVLDTAERFLTWLRGPARLIVTVGVVVDQTTGLPTGTPIPQGAPVQIHDNEQYDLTVSFEDAKGFATTDTDPVSWTSSDETVATVAVSPDTLTGTVVAGNPGSAVVTVEVTLADGTVLTATEAVDVVPAGAATINLAEGPVSVQ